MSGNRLRELNRFGQSVWLDYVRRGMIASGELQRYIDDDGVTGLTSNPTIFEKAIGGSHDYDDALKQLQSGGRDPYAIYEAIAVEDIRAVCDGLRPVYDRTNRRDGFASLEVSPAAANDTVQTIEDARRLWRALDRPNAMIKVPATRAGLPAITKLIAEGINVNVTLMFDVDNYVEVANHYIAGLERRHRAGDDLSHVASVASFFVSRVDTAVDKALEGNLKTCADEATRTKIAGLMGKAAVANAKIAYQEFRRLFGGERFAPLAAAGAQVQRPLWASTGTKNPAYSDTLYVDELVGPDTVNTMPPATLDAFRDHGQPARTVDQNVDEAVLTWRELREVGVDLKAITEQLQLDGVKLFADSFDSLIKAVASKREAVA